MTNSKSSFQFPEVRVVEASAGSGKTFALAKRYVQLVLDPRVSNQDLPIRTILAITFMKKASFEMKQRILLFLKKIALKKMNDNEAADILGPINLTLETGSPRAFEVMDALIHHYNFFQVQTIDSFINALLSGCAFKIGLSSRFRIKHNPFDYLVYSLDQLIEHAAHDAETEKLFTDFLDQYLLLENKGNWFPKKDILGLLSALYHQRNSYGMEFALRSGGDDVLTQMTKTCELIRRLKERLPEKTHASFRKALDKFCDQYRTAFDFDKLSNFFQREDFPVNGGGDIPGDVEDLWDEIRACIIKLAESEAYSLFSPYVSVFQQTLKEFQRKAAKDDVLFMEELNRKARALFDDGGVTVEELYYRLATRFKHYLVDEFQDTSRLQWENLMMMVEEALSTGGSLFYVGDKKQAIYGFRGGESALFDELKKDFAHFNVNIERLDKNYRSYEAVVGFNNTVFKLENLERFIRDREQAESEKKGVKKNGFRFNDEDYERLKSVFEGSQQKTREDKKGGYVHVERIPGTKRQERDEITREKLTALVKDLHQRFDWKDIAILTRKNAEVEQVTGWLMQEGVPVKSERTLNIAENSVVQELVALLTFLNSPVDHIAFARFILGEVFSKASGLKQDEMHAFLFNLNKNKDRHSKLALYREFRQQYPDQWNQFIGPFFRSVGFYPLYELFISILQEWNVLEHFEDQCGFVMQLLEVIKKREEDGCDLGSFLEYFENLRNEDAFVNVAELDSVEILTTHKAKGLEFPVVILPFAAMDIHVGSRGGGPKEEMGQRSFILNNNGGAIELLRIKSDYLMYSDHLYQIYRSQAVEALFNELNNIYVSLTRAGQEMYVFIPERAGNSDNLLNLLIPECLTEIGKIETGKSTVEKPEKKMSPSIVELPISQYRDWIKYLHDEFSTERDVLINRDKIQRGKELHSILSAIGNLEKDDLESSWLMACSSCFKSNEQSAMSTPEMFDSLKECFSRPDLRFLFYVEGEVFTEKEIVDHRGHTKRIDRLIVTNEEVVVVDYKLAKSEERKAKRDDQVREYMTIAGELYPGKRVKGYLLYLDDLSLEEVSL